eukprot:CAMPEP_0172435654 /NCGR_PEP_ID=MMETSP1064-20121228/71303_1 /TAXON_ID=202472 /ORGANISM="Aulacoseira subarctica , Strain CCAP 1002/5" /LENGTH=339 /DNA_ID=CAMNT_0013183999 /DNA_START=656 /DNA_END=1675 /DNA_ORIENTATION=-
MDALSILATLNPMECYRTVQNEKKTFYQINFHFSTCGNKQGRLLRRSIPLQNVAWLAAMLMMPQLILQIVYLVNSAYEEHFGYDWMMEGLTVMAGKPICLPKYSWPEYVTLVFALLPFVVTSFLTYSSQDFPSLFNESDSVINTTRLILITIIFGVPFYLLTNTAAVSSNVTCFILVILINVSVFAPSYLITIEKLRIIWSGKTIVISELLKSGTTAISLPPIASTNESSKAIKSETISSPTIVSSSRMKSDVDAADQPESVTTEIAVRMNKPLPGQLEKSVVYMKNFLVQFMKNSMSGTEIQKEELVKLKEKGKLFGEMCGRIVIISESEEEGAVSNG